VLCIHPPLLSSVNFKYQTRDLSRRCQVITMDIRGHGKSGPSKTPLTYPLIVADIRRLLDHLGIGKAFLCGYSTGGSVVLEFALTHPNRIRGGILVGGMSEVSDWRLKTMIALATALARPWTVWALRLSIAGGNADSIQTFRELFRDAGQGDPRNAAQYYRYSLKYNCTRALQLVTAPMLLVYGGNDKRFHRYGRKIQSRLKYSQTAFIPGAKHQIPTKWAPALNRIIQQFIDTHEGTFS
jgi:pimeloyl-ACP methyl ester carboxylesterase